ncbi:MAG: NTP transferase domain-containing protein [Oscillospiraceae bacterium]|nr:NTP transferase domain-containing protein [Oscillospiraceae bacterium]
MTRKEFSILTYLEQSKDSPSQRAIAEGVGVSVGTVNKILSALRENNWIDSKQALTEAGYAALEPYRAKRVIFLAAGIGFRLLPLTVNTPKPLIRINGERIIDSAIDAALAIGIEEIYIVRGHLAEQFDQLLAKYPQIRFLENPDYQETNNISSAMCARFLLQNAYVMEADLLIKNPAILKKYHYTSNCLGVPVEKTDDWCVISENGIAKELTQGSTNCHHLFSIYYLTAEDGAKLSHHIDQVYHSPGGKERFWDFTPMVYYKKEYHIEVIDCQMGDVFEIDTLRDLRAVDSVYGLI